MNKDESDASISVGHFAVEGSRVFHSVGQVTAIEDESWIDAVSQLWLKEELNQRLWETSLNEMHIVRSIGVIEMLDANDFHLFACILSECGGIVMDQLYYGWNDTDGKWLYYSQVGRKRDSVE